MTEFRASRYRTYCTFILDETRFKLRSQPIGTGCQVEYAAAFQDVSQLTVTPAQHGKGTGSTVTVSHCEPSTPGVGLAYEQTNNSGIITITFPGIRSGTCYIGAQSEPVEDIENRGTGEVSIYLSAGTGSVITGISGYPTGTTFDWRRGPSVTHAPSWSIIATNGWGNSESGIVGMFAKVPAISPPGDYTITVNTAENRVGNTNPSSFTYTLHAVSVEKPSHAGPGRGDYTTIPGYDKPIEAYVNAGRPGRDWVSMMRGNPRFGGGTSPGGSGTGALYPRCPNRSDASAPLGHNLPQERAYTSGVISASTATVSISPGGTMQADTPYTAVITHNLGTADVHVQGWFGNGPVFVPLDMTISIGQQTPSRSVSPHRYRSSPFM
jgi:hypothetical protein